MWGKKEDTIAHGIACCRCLRRRFPSLSDDITSSREVSGSMKTNFIAQMLLQYITHISFIKQKNVSIEHYFDRADG